MAKPTVAQLEARLEAYMASTESRVATLEAQVKRLFAQSHAPKTEAPAAKPRYESKQTPEQLAAHEAYRARVEEAKALARSTGVCVKF